MDDDQPLTPLHPDHVKVLRLRALVAALPFTIAAVVAEIARLLPPGAFVIPVLAAALFLVLRIPLRRYYASGYRLGEERLQVLRGLLFRSDTVVPFGRVQHIDVHQGPLERRYGLATLVVHTAGTHNASVALPGLGHADAVAMREDIRQAIRRGTQ